MTALEHFVSPALTRALGWTLLHSLWQGALVAAVLAGALLLLRRQRAEVRYAASAGALGAVVVLAALTFGLYFNANTNGKSVPGSAAAQVAPGAFGAPANAAAATGAGAGVGAAGARKISAAATPGSAVPAALPLREAPATTAVRSFTHSLIHALNSHLPLLVVGWLLGLLAMGARLLGGLLYVRRLKRHRVRAVSAAWQERLAALAARGGLRRPVALLESGLVQVPLVVGHVRPVILLPLGAVAGLSVAHLEAILAHELAHVLRRDYLVNLLQTVAEALFFYHPAVWFMARCVRTERENCCDDAATALCGGDALRLARALTALAEWSQSAVVPTAPRLALAALGSRGALLNRVRRLVQRRPAAPTLAEGCMAGALVLGGLGLLGGSVALAGPLARTAMPATPQAAAGIPKRVAGAAATTSPAAPANQPREGRQEIIIAAGTAVPGQEGRHRRRASWNEQPVSSTILVNKAAALLKNEKGQMTDFVVNGPRLEAETSKHQLKAKARKDHDGVGQAGQRVEVPAAAAGSSGARGYADAGRRQLARRAYEAPTLEAQWPPLHEQQQVLPARMQALRDRIRDAAGEGPAGAAEEAQNGAGARADRDRARAERERRHAARDQAHAERRRQQDDALVAELLKDGLIADQGNFQFKLTATGLTVNGKPQPDAVFRKYRQLHERRTGRQLTGHNAVVMTRNSDSRTIIGGNDAPAPPRPPRAPRPPRTPLAPGAMLSPPALPAPPAPPAPPHPDSEALRDALRQDGLIGAADKSFQLQLDASGLTVNGKKQPAELAARYRKLTGHDKGAYNIVISEK